MGLPINLPRRLVKNKSAFTAEWGNSIREAIWRLSKRKHPIQTAPGGGTPHPFKVTKTSDPEKNPDTDLDISKGLMITHRTNGTGDLSEPISLVSYFLEYDGETTVTATGEGYVYLLCDIELVIVGDDTLSSSIRLFSEREVFAGTPSIVYSEDAPADYDPQNEGTPRNFAIPLAFVEMDEGIASVETQFVKWDIPPIGGSATYEVTP